MKFITKYNVLTIDGRDEEQVIGKFDSLLAAELFAEFWAGQPQQNINASLASLNVVEGLVTKVAVRSNRSKTSVNITTWHVPLIEVAA